MIRFVCRFVGLLSLTAAAAALGYDGATSVFARSMYVSSVGSVWENIPRSWLAALQPAVERLALLWCDVSSLISQTAGLARARHCWCDPVVRRKKKPLIGRGRDCANPCVEPIAARHLSSRRQLSPAASSDGVSAFSREGFPPPARAKTMPGIGAGLVES